MEVERLNSINPFKVGRFVAEEFFCDRDSETAILIKHVTNGRNVALISPRRLGKSGLIGHLFQQDIIKQNYYTFYIDIYSTQSIGELVYVWSKELHNKLQPLKTPWTEQFFKIISSLRIGFKLDGTTGDPTFDLGLGDIKSPDVTLEEIFTFMESADKPCLVAIDEFQQIVEYGEKGVEAALRSKIQQCKNTSFIFAGSKRHVMSMMFNSPKKPFYQSAISMGLDPIPEDTYIKFAIEQFARYGKSIDADAVQLAYRTFSGVTWFVQMVMNELYAITPFGELCPKEKVPEAINNVVLSQEVQYKEILSMVPPKQKQVLQAIAKEGCANGITSAQFIRKYQLPSASSIQSAVKGLMEKEILTQEDGSYRIYDYFFSYWIAKVY